MKLFFKQLRPFLIYDCFVIVLMCMIFIDPHSFNVFSLMALPVFFIKFINPLIVGFMGYYLQNKYRMSIGCIFLSGIFIFFVTLLTTLIIKIPDIGRIIYNDKISEFSFFIVLALVTMSLFIISATITRAVDGRINRV